MIRVVVGGATGKMGSTICSLIQRQDDMRLVGGIVSASGGHVGTELAPGVSAVGEDRMTAVLSGVDVYVDVTSPDAAGKTLPRAVESGVNVVVGTTALDERTVRALREGIGARGLSAVLTPNFSIGVNVFWKTCGILAKALQDYDVEIVEVHHNMKKDAPSGTAKRAAEIIASQTGRREMVYGRQGVTGPRGRVVGIHSVRAGDVVGEHTVIFAGRNERIELSHRAHSRDAFAEGCLAAVRWVAPRRDGIVHTMEEVLGLC